MTETPRGPEDEGPQDPYGEYGPQYGQPSYGQPPSPPYGGQSPYGQPAGYPPYGRPPDHPRATTVLVLGILGLVVCGVLAPFAWRMGKRTVEEIDASNGRLGGRSAAQAGYVLGLIGSVLLGLAVLAVVVLGVLAIGAAVTSSTSS